MEEKLVQQLPLCAHIYLNAEGTGDYPTIQAAVDAVPKDNLVPTVIHLKPGFYHERVVISGDKPHLTLKGEDAKTTIISHDFYAGMTWENGDPTTTFRTATVNVYANHFTAQQITFENSYDGSKQGGRQALALYASGEHHVYRNCRFTGGQDTLYAKDGSQYYKDCYIDGDVDFIFGGARAVFETCEIYCKNPTPEDIGRKGYIAAPSTPAHQKYGFLFWKCTVGGNFAPGTMFLGRPWHPASDPYYVGSCVFKECVLGDVITECGWKQMGGFQVMTNRLYEYQNEGPGAAAHEMRRQLTDEQAAEYTTEKVLSWQGLGYLE